MGTHRTVLLTLAIALSAWPTQGREDGNAEFLVLRSERVVRWVYAGQSASLNCSITGMGNMAQMMCRSYTMQNGVPLVFHTALVVSSDGVGYIVACGGGLLWRIGCKPLVAGQSLKGSVEGGKLALIVASKTRSYRIVTSAYVGSLAQEADHGHLPTPPAPLRVQSDENNTGPSVRPAMQVEPSTQDGPGTGPPAKKGSVMFVSEPQGADIFVDGRFVGNTPSLIELAPGSRNVRIEAQGRKPWTRVLDVTAGNKVTIQAVLATEQ